jgi:uncharacterized protein YecT (DUF1311 family)
MPTDRFGEPWSETTYNGFSGAPEPPRRRRLPPVTGRNVAIGAGAAIALGLVVGLWARPDFGKDPSEAAERRATPVPIEINKPPPPPVRSAGKLEVLPPDEAAAANAPAASSGSSAIFILGPPTPVAQAVRAPAHADVPARPLPTASPPADRAGFDCAGARSAAEAMVCGDSDLAAVDRELARAYRRALQSGSAAPSAIRADQRDWLAIREDAARHSRRALANVYQQRIEELNAIADGADDDGPGA